MSETRGVLPEIPRHPDAAEGKVQRRVGTHVRPVRYSQTYSVLCLPDREWQRAKLEQYRAKYWDRFERPHRIDIFGFMRLIAPFMIPLLALAYRLYRGRVF